jgi:hypothetical protein
LVPESSRSSPFCMWALVVSFSPSWTKLLVLQDSAIFWLGPRSLSSSRVWSLGFLESCLLHYMTCTGLQGLVKVLDELIPEVLLSTLKPCINTKLQNRHAQCDALGFQPGLLTLMNRSTALTLISRRSTWVITSKTSPTTPKDTPWSTHGQGWVKTLVKPLEHPLTLQCQPELLPRSPNFT